jgi:DNA gyrase subunit A
VLPSRFPNLLVNGSQGIAVGMATNIPPHNLGEVIDAAIHVIDHPEATADDLMQFVHGPDFPTGGEILGRAGIVSAYRTGRGSIKIRGKAEIVEGPRGDQIVISEIPYQTSVEAIEEKIAELVNHRVIDGIRAIRNASAKGRYELVVELKRDASGLVVLNNLYKHTPLQTTFAVNFVALVDGVPRTLGLRDALGHYVDHQREVITRRSQYRLDKARARAHIVEGLLKALDLIDEIIEAIRQSPDRAGAKAALMAEPFRFSEEQAEHILDMQLARLTRLGRSNLEEELLKLRSSIAELESILGDAGVLDQVIKTEITAIRDTYASPRVTPITFDPGDLNVEDLIDDEEVVVLMTARGYIKSVSADAFRTQGRGGRGVAGTKLKDEDYVTDVIHTSAHAYLMFFSNRGRVYRLKAHQIPIVERHARGTALVNLLQLQPDEKIQAVIDTRDYETQRYLMFVTRRGVGKKTLFNAYDSSRQAGLIAINLRDDDELVRVLPCNDGDQIMVVSKGGKGIRFEESDVRAMGRDATGVRVMRLTDRDWVVSADVVASDLHLLTITDAGFGKRTAPSGFSIQGRGGQGMRAMRLHADKGAVIAALMVAEEDHVMMVADSGVTIRLRVGDISVQGRDATGVRVMNLDQDTAIVAVARVLNTDTEEDPADDSADA